MITLKNIEKVYQTKSIETVALHNVNLEIPKGEFVSIMGPSGCGKSTLLNIMGLLDEPTNGLVEIDGTPISNYRDKQLARLRNQKLGFVFQSYHLINDLSVLDNVELPLLYRSGTSASETRRLALTALEKVGLSARTKHFPSQLSGGQRQRVAIARALIGQPEIILADEPTGNLDSVMGEEIMNILLNLNRIDGTTIVMVTHDENMAHKTGRLIRFFDGQQVSDAKTATYNFQQV
ncbi:ABC transporter ATP-binding protein [Pontibacter ruber]|uniref:ABC transporter ATP-binding protein n=1 Tax=Pontibacter ruber TaxID=1343895 RepID=A0ABW5CV06_9BACT|nr:ABC transporter ATP-binding protein [Pontibacter ruber]